MGRKAPRRQPAPDTPLGDTFGALKRWFRLRAGAVVLRPDHFAGAACLHQQVSKALAAIKKAGFLR